MDLTTFRAAFLLLLLAWLRYSVADVAPPTNVTLHCHNMKNVLKWSYEDPPPPGLRFRVNIYSQMNAPAEKWVEPPAQHLDVSFLNDSEDDYLVDVNAVIGQNESACAPPDAIIFSYFQNSLAMQKCNVDFPSVNVTAQDNGSLLFRFAHPWLLYFQKPPRKPREKTRKNRSAALPLFKYGVQIVNQETEHHFSCQESVCEQKLLLNAAQKDLCLKMHGELQKISVQATQAYCALRQETLSYFLPICVCGAGLAVLSLGLVVLMLYRKGTAANIAVPNFLIHPNKPPKATHAMPKEAFNVPQVGPGSPTPLLQAEEEEDPTPLGPRFTEPEFRLPLGVSERDEGLMGDVGGGLDGESGYMAGRDLDEEDEKFEAPYSGSSYAGYEQRPVLDNLSPGELTEGYRG
ncbi:interferon gamma receptor 1-like [Pungitius pungitius]|uniref:interferon gamma receptor 1-like n=1 Tax=Pungitius pungitius TaxID=134920 RepID=UPI002E10C054